MSDELKTLQNESLSYEANLKTPGNEKQMYLDRKIGF